MYFFILDFIRLVLNKNKRGGSLNSFKVNNLLDNQGKEFFFKFWHARFL